MPRDTTMRRLALTCALAATAAAGALVAHADTTTARPGTHRFTTVDAMVPVVDGPTNSHHVSIQTRLYIPDNATAKTPQPAIVQTGGFGVSVNDGEITGMASFLARHGYVVLTYTSQGFGGSGGCIALQSRTYDVKDAEQLITQLLVTKPYVKRDAKGPIVGTVGGSYGGGIQLNLAESDPRIRAIAPGRTWNTLQYSLDPNNWVVPGDPTGFTHTLAPQGVFKKQWTSLFFASGMGQPVGGLPPTGKENGNCPQDKATNPADAATIGCTGYRIELCETYAKLAATGDADASDKALIADSSGSTEIGKLRVPTLLVQGQSDTLFNENDAVSTYLALRRNHVPVQMIWNSGGHGGYDSLPGECEVYGSGTTGLNDSHLDDCYLTLRTLTFFDHWLRGAPDRTPGFTWYRDWVAYSGKGATTQYGEAPAFPLPGSRTFPLSTMTASGAQLVNPAGGVPAAYTETSNFTGPRSSPDLGQLQPTEIPGQHVDFTSAPFPTAVDSVGVPSTTLVLSHLAPSDLVLFGKVYDVAPDGTATLIHRLIAPVRIPSNQLAQPVQIHLLGFAHRFAAGHSVRLTLATTDLTSANNPVADVITVTPSGSSFTLPYRKA